MQFFEFSNAYNFGTKHRGELGNPSFSSEFFALSDDYIHKYFCQTFRKPEISVERFSGKLSSQSFF
jgi:hypothetical protein